MIEVARVVDRLKQGGASLTREELTEIRERLQQDEPPSDLYDLARALALGAPPTSENVSLVDRWLLRTDDDWDIQGVIYALCDYWGLTREYLGYLKEQISVGAWEKRPSAAIAAFGALGDELYRTQDGALCKALLKAFDDDLSLAITADDRFRFQHFAACYSALKLGVKGRAAVVGRHNFKSLDDIDPDVVAKARRIASTAT